jgi:hypothetical protein
MPKDVTLGEGRMGEALLQAYPGQYRDAASESSVFNTSAVHLAQPGAYAGHPMAVGDPDMPANQFVEQYVPGVGKVAIKVPVGHTVKPTPIPHLYQQPYQDVKIPAPPKLSQGPPVMRYKKQANPAPTVPWMRGVGSITPYPQDVAGLGETEAEKQAMRDYYYAMLDRGLEVAEKVKAVADEWARMQETMQQEKQRVTETILQAIPGQDDEMIGNNLQPALDKIDNLFLEPEDKLMDMAALQGWIEINLSSNVVPTMEKIRTALGLGFMDSPKAVEILSSVGLGRPAANYYAENWLLSTWSEVSAYLSKVAPQLAKAKSDLARQKKMAAIVQGEINKSAPEMMARLGITQAEIDQAMKQIGLGNPIVFLVVIAVVLAIGMTAAGAAAVYYHGLAKAAADEGLAGVQKIDTAWREEYQKLLTMAKEGASQDDMNVASAQAGSRMTALTDQVADNIRKAKPSDFGLGSGLLVGALVVAGVIVLAKFV